jgi:G:T-mismatch repair DNA endonuclease (very short patch repair protein)
LPKSNRKFWKTKIKNNKKRDKKNYRKIRSIRFKLIII